MKLKREYEMTFKEGFRLGVRLTRAKGLHQKMPVMQGDLVMRRSSKLFME